MRGARNGIAGKRAGARLGFVPDFFGVIENVFRHRISRFLLDWPAKIAISYLTTWAVFLADRFTLPKRQLRQRIQPRPFQVGAFSWGPRRSARAKNGLGQVEQTRIFLNKIKGRFSAGWTPQALVFK